MVESIVTVVLEVAKCLGPPTERQLSSVRNYRSNLENLMTELEKLKDDSAGMQHRVDEAKRKGEEIERTLRSGLQVSARSFLRLRNLQAMQIKQTSVVSWGCVQI